MSLYIQVYIYAINSTDVLFRRMKSYFVSSNSVQPFVSGLLEINEFAHVRKGNRLGLIKIQGLCETDC